ncbi:hypothetical protein CBR_g739 [Chara braunii]|uniref:Uncharacterized protein n=1 Tax=Chara braunii TaxID=69332 RepID=A0A388KC49_CHABU|nr:hypothetical protein CBR_g739 [Chara braunii]|eukprot:GBG67609.1 hypothetical protein CBR_g739 [Chara braunii]
MNPYGYSIPPSYVNAQPVAQWQLAGSSSAPAQARGQFNQGYGRGVGGFQPRAFFTREHADFIEKLKLKDAVEEAQKKDLEEITRLKGFGMGSEKKKEQPRESERREKSRRSGKDIGKNRSVEEGKEDELKKWVATNFGGSLKILSEKLEEVDKKSKLKEDELEEVRMLRAEKEPRDLRENSSSEKRKREISSPARPLKGKSRSRFVLLRRKGKEKEKSPKPVEVSSDEDRSRNGRDAVVQNLSGKLERSSGGSKDMAELKSLLFELLAEKGRDASSSNAAEGQTGKPETEELGRRQQEGDAVEPPKKVEGIGKNIEGEQEEGSLGLYFKDRVIYYDAMHYTKIQALRKKKGIPYKRKEGGVWELARLDFEVLLKLGKEEEIEDEKEEGKKSDEEESADTCSSESEEESQGDDLAGN